MAVKVWDDDTIVRDVQPSYILQCLRKTSNAQVTVKP